MPSPATEIDVDGVLVRITNPDKPFYPALGANGTKGKLIDYYRAVAGGPMLTGGTFRFSFKRSSPLR